MRRDFQANVVQVWSWYLFGDWLAPGELTEGGVDGGLHRYSADIEIKLEESKINYKLYKVLGLGL